MIVNFKKIRNNAAVYGICNVNMQRLLLWHGLHRSICRFTPMQSRSQFEERLCKGIYTKRKDTALFSRLNFVYIVEILMPQ